MECSKPPSACQTGWATTPMSIFLPSHFSANSRHAGRKMDWQENEQEQRRWR
jgi:hypothetical protein